MSHSKTLAIAIILIIIYHLPFREAFITLATTMRRPFTPLSRFPEKFTQLCNIRKQEFSLWSQCIFKFCQETQQLSTFISVGKQPATNICMLGQSLQLDAWESPTLT